MTSIFVTADDGAHLADLVFVSARNAQGSRVPVGPRLTDRFDQLVLKVFRRVEIRVAHAEIDNVGAALARRCLEPIDLLEDGRRQALNPVELMRIGHDLPRAGRIAKMWIRLGYSKVKLGASRVTCQVSEVAPFLETNLLMISGAPLYIHY